MFFRLRCLQQMVQLQSPLSLEHLRERVKTFSMYIYSRV